MNSCSSVVVVEQTHEMMGFTRIQEHAPVQFELVYSISYYKRSESLELFYSASKYKGTDSDKAGLQCLLIQGK